MKKIFKSLMVMILILNIVTNVKIKLKAVNNSEFTIENINYDNNTEMLSFEIFSKNGLKPGYFGIVHSGQELNAAYSKEKGEKYYMWRINNSSVTPIYFEHDNGSVKVGEMTIYGTITFNENITSYRNIRLKIQTKLSHQPLYSSNASTLEYDSILMIDDSAFGKFNVRRPSFKVSPYTNNITTIKSLIQNGNIHFEDYMYPKGFKLQDGMKLHIKKINPNSKIMMDNIILNNGNKVTWSFLDSLNTKLDVDNNYSFSVSRGSAKSTFNETETEFVIDLPNPSDSPTQYTHLILNGYIIPNGEIPENLSFYITNQQGVKYSENSREITRSDSNANGAGNQFSDSGTQTDNPGMVDASTDTNGMVNTGDINTQVDVTKVPINLSAKRNFESGITTITGEAEPGSIVYIVANGNNYNVTTNDEGKFIVELEKLQKGDKLVFTAQVGEKLESDENYTIVTEDRNNGSQTDNPGMVDASTDTNDIPKNNKETGTQTDFPEPNNKNNIPPALTTPSAETPQAQTNYNKSNRKLPKTGTAGLAAVSSVNGKSDKKGKENSKELVNKAENKKQSKNDNPESSSPYAADARQFITFETKNGKTFHLVINHDEKSENVMLLTEISEDDLLNMVERKEPVKKEVKVEEQPKQVEKEPVKQEKKSELGTYLLIGLVAIVGAVGAYFFKKHKKEEADNLASFEENDIDDNELEEIDDIDI